MFSAGLGLLGLAGQLIRLVTGDVASGLLSLAFDILGGGFHVIYQTHD
jgi:hypothetical protein